MLANKKIGELGRLDYIRLYPSIRLTRNGMLLCCATYSRDDTFMTLLKS